VCWCVDCCAETCVLHLAARCAVPCCATGSGSAPQGQVYAQATTTSSYVTATGNTAISPQVQVDFTSPTQQWDIAGCVSFRCVCSSCCPSGFTYAESLFTPEKGCNVCGSIGMFGLWQLQLFVTVAQLNGSQQNQQASAAAAAYACKEPVPPHADASQLEACVWVLTNQPSVYTRPRLCRCLFRACSDRAVTQGAAGAWAL
jgi:hypothetical protein